VGQRFARPEVKVAMLDAFIIEQIQRRERKSERVQPSLEQPGRFPLEPLPEPREPKRRDDDYSEDGIIYLDM
jgi:hypothetical protein